jgi:hypothetical protein
MRGNDVQIDAVDGLSLTASLNKDNSRSLEFLTKLVKICSYGRCYHDVRIGEGSYSICNRDDLGDHLLRCVIAYV